MNSFYCSSQNPHGETIGINCASCHNADGWSIDMDTFDFNHDTMRFDLSGRHQQISCKDCHTTLIFEQVENDCIGCHNDIHSMSVGNDCIRCHTSENWLVDNIPEIHEENGFPLIGSHNGLSCIDCHLSETNLRFDRIGNDCINCHLDDFNSTMSPDHNAAGFSKDCTLCHIPDDSGWDTDIVDHSFFPLTQGHDIQDCNACHTSTNYSDVSSECISCHQDDFDNALNPNHSVLGFDMDCAKCHTIDPNWQPANFSDHDATYFPIYSGEHEGEWMECTDCHTNVGDYSIFTCVSCHTNPETDNEHDGVDGYIYDDQACLACHPNGDSDMTFDHNTTNFPLTGQHLQAECLDCHSNGFEGTSTNCYDCHEMDFNSSLNPDHNSLGLSNECAQCHTTDPEWMPAGFDIHDDFYALNGAHLLIANDCASCHNGDYNNTPNTCVGCHLSDFENTENPNHVAANFSTECFDCHNETAWIPSTFDHDAQYFPIYSGEHQGEWAECVDCHIQEGDYSVFSCITCHINPETDEVHQGVSGYVYEDNACLACHPTGDADMAFNHDETNFPLTGAHLDTDCLDCHSNGFEGTSTLCVDCHTMDFQGASNPNHQVLNLSTDCINCHTTEPDWMPARFDIHDDYYPLEGAHALIADDCVSCHNGEYNNTPNTCFGCHDDDYNATVDPNHSASMFSTECTTCHTEDAWLPSTFDHDNQYFPIYSGKHDGEWMECLDCHTVQGDFTIFSCVNCHINPETDEEHLGVPGYMYEDNACLACHPTGDSDFTFNHDDTGFSLTGSHLNATCLDCHISGFENTSSDCVSCHQNDFNVSANPNHGSIGLPTDCMSCHTTEPDWMPATFAIHDDYYPLNGAHVAIADNCVECHNGDYNNTPNTCFGCHQADYNATLNPNHQAAQFNTDCTTCHTEDAWTPATFDHDGQYFPIYSGEHEGEWSTCTDCHTSPNNYAIFSCINCHINPETDEDHEGIGGYIYEDNACLACHPNGEAGMAFDHNSTGFPLTGGHLGIDCLDCHANGYSGTSSACNDCHNDDYLASLNPNHNGLAFPTDCESCHTTDPGWSPATFTIHDNYYPLTGEHLSIADNCVECHVGGDYNNTASECIGCHQTDYNNSINPNHANLAIPTECIDCHTTAPDWTPATFDIHDDYYTLNGAHAAIANDCVSCHTGGDFNNTPNTCIGCHQSDYDGTTNPDHSAAMFPTDCLDCHNEDAWTPASWDHDGQYFPIYSGEHDGEWSACIDCHLNPNDYSEFSCINCHLNPETDDDHNGIGGYVYEDNACLACHPTGDAGQAFDHNNTAFPLTGAHLTINCLDCHSSGYVGTPTDCDACHDTDFMGTTNPNHSALGLSTDCTSCHTTDPGWMPATFDIHDNYYPLTGAHLNIADNCVDCHNGDYNNTPNDCVGCHQVDYTNTSNPNHGSINIPTDCVDCHTTDPGWIPATFDIHDNYYPLTGAHLAIADNCIDCHNGDYNNTPNDCVGCHQPDYNSSVNPDHGSLGLPTDCVDCHTTDPDWMPATFDIHDNYYPLNGAHAAIANDCAVCHNGNYTSTPNTCYGCHQNDYDNTNNPDHNDAMFPTDCLSCHNENAWTPSTWDHDGQYFPIYSGKHEGEWNQCIDCHTVAGDFTTFSCIDCHEHDNQSEVDDDHSGVSGYIYQSAACYSCHPTGED